MSAMLRRPREWPMDAEYRIDVRLYLEDGRRSDVDNYLKAILDGLNKTVWNDDAQVRQVSIDRFIDRNRYRVEVEVTVVDATPDVTVGLPKPSFRKLRQRARSRLRASVAVAEQGTGPSLDPSCVDGPKKVRRAPKSKP